MKTNKSTGTPTTKTQESFDPNLMVFLHDKELMLRPVDKSDIGFFLRWFNDREVTRNLLTYLPVTWTSEEEWLADLEKRKGRDIMLVMVVRNRPIGTIGFHRISWLDRTANLGISIGDKRYWGKGYGTRAIKLLLDYGFNTLNLRKVCLSVISFNELAIGCYDKCGFKQEGVLKQQIFRDGEYYDEIMMAVFARAQRT